MRRRSEDIGRKGDARCTETFIRIRTVSGYVCEGRQSFIRHSAAPPKSRQLYRLPVLPSSADARVSQNFFSGNLPHTTNVLKQFSHNVEHVPSASYFNFQFHPISLYTKAELRDKPFIALMYEILYCSMALQSQNISTFYTCLRWYP